MKQTKARVRVGRIFFLALTILFSISIIVQVYLAGIAIFLNPSAWIKHMMFVHIFGYNLPILMIIFAVVGSMPRWAYWYLLGILVSIFLMYFTAHMPWMGPFHPVLAILLFVLSCSIIIKTWGLIKNKSESEG